MRILVSASSPLPQGRGFLFGNGRFLFGSRRFLFGSRRLIAVAVAVGALLVAVPAHAVNVTVKLRVSVGGYAGAVKQCSGLSVPEGSGGLVVLAKAKQDGCIGSYASAQFSGLGSYVTCIDPKLAPVATSVCEVAEGLVTYWAYYKNGTVQQIGVDGFNAKAGDELALAYTNFGTCLTYPDCPL